MTHNNVELVRSAYEAYERGDVAAVLSTRTSSGPTSIPRSRTPNHRSVAGGKNSRWDWAGWNDSVSGPSWRRLPAQVTR